MVTCKDCLHNHVCALWRAQEGQDAKSWSDSDDWDCDYFDDKSRFMKLPCKVGDTVYQIDAEQVYEYKVTNIVYDTPVISFDKRAIENGSLFLTREEAEAALAERMKA